MNKLLSNKGLGLSILLLLLIVNSTVFGQLKLSGSSNTKIDYGNPQKYELGGITVSGTKMLDPNAIILLTGLTIGNKIDVPGDDISKAIKNLWGQGLFSNVEVSYTRIQGNKIFLNFHIEEQPRLSRFSLKGVRKAEADKLREKINLYKEKIVTHNLVITTKNTIRTYFVDKGFYNTTVDIVQKQDTLFDNHVMLIIHVKKNKKVRINKIAISGNEKFSERKIKRVMKDTKEKSVFRPFWKLGPFVWNTTKSLFTLKLKEIPDHFNTFRKDKYRLRIFKSSKFITSNFDQDKNLIIEKYRSKGYRDAKIVSDSVYAHNYKSLNIDLKIEEGNRYYFRNIKFIGNSKYSTERLSNILGIKKGDVYDPTLLDQRLFMNPGGIDVTSLYMDDGYLFFQITPVETNVENDSIDLELRIYEGQQARINKIIISGNTKTNDHVIRREIRTKPGDLFSRADIIRTQRELSLLGYFDPQAMDVTPRPNPENGTVDIEYKLTERPSDQIELSGGWGGGTIVGTLGLSFSNFSVRNIFNKSAWAPLPSGDGQRLSIRAQTNGSRFQSYNISFTEPWLGGKRPNALSVSTFYSIQSNGLSRSNENRQSLDIFGVSVGLGRRLQWPDDNFQLYQEISFQNYNVNKYLAFENFNNGHANNIFYKFVVSRSSVDDLNFPRSGSRVTLTGQLTPPYSLFNGLDYKTASVREKFKFVEYNKWKFTSAWYTSLVGKLVLYTKAGFGGLFQYNSKVGPAPFERFYLGGSGLTGFQLDAREIIALRGYDDRSLSSSTGATLINKYTAEVRYPFSLNPSAMIYGLTFFEAGNTWNDHKKYNPFELYRSAGLGVRIFLPMFGLLGLDYGFRLDDVPGRNIQKSQIHFTIGANLGEL